MVSWGLSDKHGAKAFGLFPTPEAFVEALLAQPERFGYEVIISGHLCKLYIDMEWYDELDNKEHAHLKKFMGDLRRVCIKEFDVNPKRFITCCSRMVPDEGPKNSYHIEVGNIAFECNHDGKMKQFLQTISENNNGR